MKIILLFFFVFYPIFLIYYVLKIKK